MMRQKIPKWILGILVLWLCLLIVLWFSNSENNHFVRTPSPLTLIDYDSSSPVTTKFSEPTKVNVLETFKKLRQNGLLQNSTVIKIFGPSIFGMLDHLSYLENRTIDDLIPRLRISKNRRNVEIVIGLPSTQRPHKASYLFQTLNSLLENVDQVEQNQILIVIYLSNMDPSDPDYVLNQASAIYEQFSKFINQGLIEILVPPHEYYPDFSQIPATLGDSPAHMAWRTKQNLDYAFLMAYCRIRGKYYLQLEDDVISKPGYYSKIQDHVGNQTSGNPDWFMLEYSRFGFIAKLFRTSDLSGIIDFILIYYKIKPVDWLLYDSFYVRYCAPGVSPEKCQKIKDTYVVLGEILFEHIGNQSSLLDAKKSNGKLTYPKFEFLTVLLSWLVLKYANSWLSRM